MSVEKRSENENEKSKNVNNTDVVDRTHAFGTTANVADVLDKFMRISKTYPETKEMLQKVCEKEGPPDAKKILDIAVHLQQKQMKQERAESERELESFEKTKKELHATQKKSEWWKLQYSKTRHENLQLRNANWKLKNELKEKERTIMKAKADVIGVLAKIN